MEKRSSKEIVVAIVASFVTLLFVVLFLSLSNSL